MNMVLGTDDLEPKLQIRANFAPIFMKCGTHNKWNMLEQRMEQMQQRILINGKMFNMFLYYF